MIAELQAYALAGIQQELDIIEQEIAEKTARRDLLRQAKAMLLGETPTKRIVSPETREKMRLAQQKRWAKKTRK